jgi:hypothetical protein
VKKIDKLVNETLLEASNYSDRLIEGIREYIDLLNKDIYSEASKKLVDIVEGLDWEFSAISLMQDKLAPKFELQDCKELFKQLSEAIQNSDLVLISDLLQYEIIPLLEKWNAGLREEIKARGIE